MTTISNPILPTKLYIPPLRKTFVPRARLLKRLNAGLEGKLTLICAPPGYGKSTLLSEWIGQSGVPVAWLSLDLRDNDPARFWSYFLAALHTIPGLKSAWETNPLAGSLQSPPSPDTEKLLAELIRTIATIPARFALVLDDLQAVTEVDLLDGLFFLLENLHSGQTGMHLVIASRNDPPWPLARLRVSGQITEIRARDLRFTMDETAAFTNDVMGLALSSQEIAELDKRAEGWVAGLQMAAISMQDRDDLGGFLAAFTGSHHFVLDYLVEEVLSKQTPQILAFLLQTSILERLTEPLCRAVTGEDRAADLMLQLEKANLFLVALDDQRRWYRYHHLFADLLQKQLHARHPDQVPALHRQASQWYAQHGFPEDAVAHALKTEDWDYAAVQIEGTILDLIQRGELTLARQWMRYLPQEAIRPRPILCIAQAWTSAKYATVALAEEMLAQAQAALANGLSENGVIDPQVYESLSSQIAVLQVVIARVRGDSTYRQQELALEALDHIVPPDDAAARASLILRLGFCYLDLGKDEMAGQNFSQAFALGKSSGSHFTAYAANYGRMVIARRQGRLNALDAICRQALDSRLPEGERGRSLDGNPLIMAGSLSYERNDLDRAERLLVQGIKMVEDVGMTELLVKGHFALACLKIAQEKKEQLPDFELMTENNHPGLVRYAKALQVRLALLLLQQGQDPHFEAQAIRWAETQELILGADPTYDWEIFEKLVYARVLCMQIQIHPGKGLATRLRDSLSFIEGQRQMLDQLNWQGVQVEAAIVKALVLHSLERKAAALVPLEDALVMAEPQGYLRTFLDEGQPMRELLQLALAEGLSEAYTKTILSRFGDPAQTIRSQSPSHPTVLLETLSKREMQVLRLLNTQLSVPEIAAEIHLAPTTVRTHVQHIYRKLDVHGRIEALQRALEIGLL